MGFSTWVCRAAEDCATPQGMATTEEQLRIEATRAAWWCRHYARERGLSLDKLAAFSNVGRNSVVDMANRAPSLRTLSAVAAYLGVQVMDLLRPIPDEG